ncbi:MAG TPA: winged helix-turn-helix domain-containing protein [Candidatus Thermoplasmatota archaeon]|nr:winged helix-turn-helix domain-containing protein [Candidatus Thermoplasmatota archaeon]
MPRRERQTLIGVVLAELSRAAGDRDASVTQVAARCNMPYDRFKELLEDLRGKGLIHGDDPFRLTPEGRKLLEAYRAWREALRLFGMSPDDADRRG